MTAKIWKITLPKDPALPIILNPVTPAKIINTTIAIPRFVSEARFKCGFGMDFMREFSFFSDRFFDFAMDSVSNSLVNHINYTISVAYGTL